MQLKPEEPQRVDQEEKARLEARTRIEVEGRQSDALWKKPPMMLGALAFIVLIGFCLWFYQRNVSRVNSSDTKVQIYLPTPAASSEEVDRLLVEYHALRQIAHPSRSQYDQMRSDLNLIGAANPKRVANYDARGKALGLVGEAPLGPPPVEKLKVPDPEP